MTRPSLLIAPALATLLASGLAARAASTDWFETEGGRVRLVTSGVPDAEGRLAGVLDIALEPGWKTYWRDPGDAGVPPTVDVSRSTNVASAELFYPTPGRHDEGDFTWAGYDRPVALPVTFQALAPGSPVVLEADVFLGICETICIPVKAEFQLDPASDPDNADDAALVAAARAALPAPASPAFGARVVAHGDGVLTIEAKVPGDPAAADIFVAGTEDYVLGTPKRETKDGAVVFTVPADGPAIAPAGATLHYTLVSPAGAVEGTFTGF